MLNIPLSSIQLDVAVRLAAIGTLLFFTYATLRAIYNVTFHPLASYPGPLLWRAYRTPYLICFMRGKLPPTIHDLHEKYGLIVRIAPDELSFLDPQAWKDIHGARNPEFEKLQRFYRPQALQARNILTADTEEHGMLRKQLLPGFSEKSMRMQEPMITYYVDLLVQRLGEHCKASAERRPIDMTAWLNFTTFDIIGDLAFGEPFGCLEQSDYHPWVRSLNNVPAQHALLNFAGNLGLGSSLAKMAALMSNGINDAIADSRRKMHRRKALGSDRGDLIESLIKHGANMGSLCSNAYLLTVAGSETSATLLTAVVALLLANPDKYDRITKEVRGKFSRPEQITMSSVSDLSYMLACLDEGLRCFPPVSFGLPRVVPEGGAHVLGKWLPVGTVVSVCQWAQHHSKRYWEDPWEYKPERFLPDGKLAGDNHDAFHPFSYGQRDCIGRTLAYAEMRLILARMLFDFDFEAAEPGRNFLTESEPYFLWNKAPLKVYLKPVVRSEK